MRLVAVCCILSWRIFWMTMIKSHATGGAAPVALTRSEMGLIDQLFPMPPADTALPRSLGLYIGRIAQLGGYLARARDPSLEI